MKSLILVAVILQLVIIGIKTDQKYQFGDIIEFPRFRVIYSHYAVYVGPESVVNVGQGDNDIFHRIAMKEKKYICEFGKLDETRGKSIDKKNNYLDDEIPAGNRTTDKIKERIEEKKEECQKHKYLTNNCEHLATYVRYGVGRSLQKGRIAQGVFKSTDLARRVADKIENIWRSSNVNNNTLCTSDAHKQVSWWPVLSACLLLFPHWFM